MKGLVVVDRDGTLIEERPYLADPEAVRLLPNTARALRALQQEGFRLVVVSNQSGVGRGYFGFEAVERVNRRLSGLLAREGVALDGFYICPHRPWADCDCRKPRTGLLERAALEAGNGPTATFVVGDKECDVEMGRRAGATTLLVRTGWGWQTEQARVARPDHVVDDLWEAAPIILDAATGSQREG